MILGIGNDLVDQRRIAGVIERCGARFLDRCFTPAERREVDVYPAPESRVGGYALRFAVKEACAKALGTGFRGGIGFGQIALASDPLGKPLVQLSGKALERLESMTPPGRKAALYVALTDESPYTLAFVVIEAD